MTMGDLVPKGDGWIVKELKDIKRRLAQLSTARVGNKMTVDGKPGISIVNGGGLTVFDGGAFTMATPSGQIIVFAGTVNIPDGSGRTQQVFEVFRDDGTPAFYIGDFGTAPGHTHHQALVISDRAGNAIFAEDTTSGFGIATPYIGMTFVDITAPQATTTSTTFQALQWCYTYQQHAKFTASVLAQTPTGTTGELRFTIGGAQIGPVITVPSGTFAQVNYGPAAWPTGTFTFGSGVTLQLEGRVTGGTGAVGARTLGAWGVQS